MRSSFSAGTPDSSVSEGDGSFRLHDRKASAPARTMTSSGIYQNLVTVEFLLLKPLVHVGACHSGSRPPSRTADSKHGSVQSLDSCGKFYLLRQTCASY